MSLKKKKISKIPFKHILENAIGSSIDTDYDYYRDCKEYGCDEEGICRCGRIQNIEIGDASLDDYVVNRVAAYYPGQGEIFKYCLDRLLRIHEIYKKEYWSVETTGGYYGQELESPEVSWEKALAIETDVKELLSKSDDERIAFILEKEYGYLLSSLKGAKYKVITVPTSSIKVGNEVYAGKVKAEDCKVYNPTNYKLPIGIYRELRKVSIHELGVSESKPMYKIIDGYHRYIQFRNQKEVSIIATNPK